MKKYIFLFLIAFALFSCSKKQKDNNTPNIIYILADDLGYGDVGVYGQTKIETPGIDALAKEGMMFTQHYCSAPVCAPSRYMLLTGKHSGHAYIRGNHEWGSRGKVWDYRAVANDSTLEGQHPFPQETKTFPKKLQELGYKTAIFGKWGLGAPHSESAPNKVGFDYFFGYNCQRQAHTYYPLHLYRNEKRVYLNNDTVPPHTKMPKTANPLDDASYQSFNLNDYSPELIFDELINFINRNKNEKFFIYWATPIPHVALQAPKKWVDYYANKFGDEKPYLGKSGYFPHKNPHAAYAAMISYLDENIGKLVQKLKDEGLYDNTLIIFTSDNGPSAHGGVDATWFNSAGNFKNKYGRTKGFVYEGGIRVPMIATWKNKIQPDSKSDVISAQYDFYATLADIVGFDNLDNNDGVSFYPSLVGKKQKTRNFLYWEFPGYGGQVAIRMGKWKVIRKKLHDVPEKQTLELYDLETDPQEENNVVEQHPEIVEKAIAIFDKEHTEPELKRFKIRGLQNGFINKKEK